MAAASLATIIRWFRGTTPESRNTDPYIASETIFLVTVSAVSLLVMLILMNIIGTYFTLVLYMYFFVRILGNHSWVTTISMMFGTPIFVYILFEVALTKYLPKGLPFFEELFLVVDNIRYELLY